MPKRKRPKKKPPPPPATSQHGPDLPYWLPSGDYWDGLPREIRDAVPRVLAPAYRKFVLDAPGELERSLGLTLVHLIWLEVCDHVRMAVATADPLSLAATLNDPDAMIARHLNLITAKCQTAELLVKLRLVTDTLNAPPLLPSPIGRGVGGEGQLLPSPVYGRGAGGEGQLLPSPASGRGAGGEGQLLPSPVCGRGAGGEGCELPPTAPARLAPSLSFPVETSEEVP